MAERGQFARLGQWKRAPSRPARRLAGRPAPAPSRRAEADERAPPRESSIRGGDDGGHPSSVRPRSRRSLTARPRTTASRSRRPRAIESGKKIVDYEERADPGSDLLASSREVRWQVLKSNSAACGDGLRPDRPAPLHPDRRTGPRSAGWRRRRRRTASDPEKTDVTRPRMEPQATIWLSATSVLDRANSGWYERIARRERDVATYALSPTLDSTSTIGHDRYSTHPFWTLAP